MEYPTRPRKPVRSTPTEASSVPAPPPPPPRDLARETAYQARALLLVEKFGMGGAAKALGMAYGSFAAFLCGQCRRSTSAFAMAQMDAIGWTPEGQRPIEDD